MADKYTDDKLYKVVRKDGSHLNTKVNPDGTKSALQFTDDNNDLNGPVDLIEVDEEELIRTEYIQVPQNKRSLGELLVDEVFVPVIRDATTQLLEYGTAKAETWIEEKVVPVAKTKVKAGWENLKLFISTIKDSDKPIKATQIIAEQKSASNSSEIEVVNKVECGNKDEKKYVLSPGEVEILLDTARRSALMIAASLSILNNSVVISNTELVNVVNRYIDHDGYKLVVSDTIGDKNFYKCISTRIGVQGEVKNIIFAAKYKPEIVFDDALNNDIRITKNENQCLIYNRPIPPTGVMWNDLVDWYAEEKNIDENREIVFIKRLCECLDTSFKAQGAKSGPETWMLQAYYNLKKELGKDLPALIPQVYLYYDPQTLKQRGYKLFEHQKMDFLMVFSHKDRVVIEIDGRQHYAEGNSASPRLYSEMVRAQREMTLFGYDVYRFGGYEFVGADSDEKKKEAVLDDLKQFFLRLFSKYSAL